jgi:hypothetical protein
MIGFYSWLVESLGKYGLVEKLPHLARARLQRLVRAIIETWWLFICKIFTLDASTSHAHWSSQCNVKPS